VFRKTTNILLDRTQNIELFFGVWFLILLDLKSNFKKFQLSSLTHFFIYLGFNANLHKYYYIFLKFLNEFKLYGELKVNFEGHLTCPFILVSGFYI